MQTTRAVRPNRDAVSFETQRLFQILHQGGSYAHLWTDAGNRSFWFCTASPNNPRFSKQTERTIFREWVRHNVFFSVHPLGRVPPHNASGNGNPRYISSQLPYIAAINTLFAEYDGKDHVRLPEYMKHLPHNFTRLSDLEQRKAIRTAQEKTFYAKPERYKERVLGIIHQLTMPPSVIIDSGGGYHCYWLLESTHPIDNANRTDVQAIQHGWVRMVGADLGASDLRRVLRVPGTYNRKPGFGAEPPLVSFIKSKFDLRYAYTDLEEVVNDWLYETETRQTIHRRVRGRGLGLSEMSREKVSDSQATSRMAEESVRGAFNRRFSVVDLLTKHGYQVAFANDNLTRLSRPGREKSNSSVIVFPGRQDGAPELSIHFSTNDDLYSEEYIHPRTQQVKRRAYDAYSVYTHLEHGGNWRKALSAAKREIN